MPVAAMASPPDIEDLLAMAHHPKGMGKSACLSLRVLLQYAVGHAALLMSWSILF